MENNKLSRPELIIHFNTILVEYLTYLYGIFPTQQAINTYITWINNINYICPSLIYTYFNKYISPLKPYCKTRDEEYFISLNNNNNTMKDNKSMLEVLNFTELWTNMNNDSKELTWNYFTLLFNISDQINDF